MSKVLTAYPTDLLSSPLDQRTASFTVERGSGTGYGADARAPAPSTALPRGVDRLTSAFTDLVAQRQLTAGFGLFAVLLAVILGGLHAFAPGHGKSLMAAYLVGRRGSLRQDATIGLSVTVTHTVGVLALGVVLSVVRWPPPSGSTRGSGWRAACCSSGSPPGCSACAPPARTRRTVGRAAPAPSPLHPADPGHSHGKNGHGHGHGHGHSARHEHAHEHPHDHPHPAVGTHSHGPLTHSHLPDPDARPGTRGLLAVGLAGGMVPSPSALVVLLGGIALGRVWFGVLLVVAYGAGMALALVGTGLLLVKARDRMHRWAAGRASPRLSAAGLWLARALPAITAAAVLVVGVGVALRGLAAI